MLETWIFTVFTDSKSLCFEFESRKDNCAPRQFRHLHCISQFITEIIDTSGKDNVVADTLSRIKEVEQPIDLLTLAEKQNEDQELEELWRRGTTYLLLKKVKMTRSTNFTATKTIFFTIVYKDLVTTRRKMQRKIQ